MNVDMFAKLLGNEDKGSVLIQDPNVKYQMEMNALTAALLDVLIRNELITEQEFMKIKERYLKEIEKITKEQLQKQWDELSKMEE